MGRTPLERRRFGGRRIRVDRRFGDARYAGREWVWYSGGVGYPMACERRASWER